jgi:DNA-binding transcriptional regulator of glucitol operon
VLLTPGWVATHFGVLVLVTGFLALGWWQITRAAAGNLLSFGYAVEWPVFAAFVVWVWIVEMRKAAGEPEPTDDAMAAVEPAPATPARRRPRNEAAYDDADDPQLAAYNHYLAWLNAHPHATPADYPGMTAKEIDA